MAWTTLNILSKYVLTGGDDDIILIRYSRSARRWLLTDTSMREMRVSDRAALMLLLHAKVNGYKCHEERLPINIPAQSPQQSNN